MAKIWYGHFDSTTEDPRELLAEDWAKYISMFLGNGIRNGGTNLQITADGSGMYTRLDEGYANINGYFFKSESDIEGGRYYTVPHPLAHPELPRIDRIVLRLDRTIAVRKVIPVVVTGEPSLSPTPPQLTRNNNIYELSLAQVRLSAGATFIKAADITDERLNSDLCGLMNSLITAETEGMFQDFTDKFFEKMNFYEVSFENQLQAQGEEFETELNIRKNAFDYWFGSAKTDIAMLQTYVLPDSQSAIPEITSINRGMGTTAPSASTILNAVDTIKAQDEDEKGVVFAFEYTVDSASCYAVNAKLDSSVSIGLKGGILGLAYGGSTRNIYVGDTPLKDLLIFNYTADVRSRNLYGAGKSSSIDAARYYASEFPGLNIYPVFCSDNYLYFVHFQEIQQSNNSFYLKRIPLWKLTGYKRASR